MLVLLLLSKSLPLPLKKLNVNLKIATHGTCLTSCDGIDNLLQNTLDYFLGFLLIVWGLLVLLTCLRVLLGCCIWTTHVQFHVTSFFNNLTKRCRVQQTYSAIGVVLSGPTCIQLQSRWISIFSFCSSYPTPVLSVNEPLYCWMWYQMFFNSKHWFRLVYLVWMRL